MLGGRAIIPAAPRNDPVQMTTGRSLYSRRTFAEEADLPPLNQPKRRQL